MPRRSAGYPTVRNGGGAETSDDSNPEVEAIASLASRRGLRVAVAESLTSGKLATSLGAGPDASEWFVGGVVAYAADVKFDLLGVTPGPVVTATCAREMAAGVARLLRADVAAAVTGVGGPDPDEGEPPGTVYLATVVAGHEKCQRLDLDGDPDDVLRQTRDAALTALRDAITSARTEPFGPES